MTNVTKFFKEASLPWADELPEHITEKVCAACVQLAETIARDGLDERREHHGFTVVIGDPSALETCGEAGFNAFRSHAFNADGAIVVDGRSGRVASSNWFVADCSCG